MPPQPHVLTSAGNVDTAGKIAVIMILNLNIVTRANLACFENLATQISEVVQYLFVGCVL